MHCGFFAPGLTWRTTGIGPSVYDGRVFNAAGGVHVSR